MRKKKLIFFLSVCLITGSLLPMTLVTRQHVVYGIASLGAAALTALLLPVIKRAVLRRQLRYQGAMKLKNKYANMLFFFPPFFPLQR